MEVVNVSFNGTEVTVKLSPNSTAKVIMDGAEFIIEPSAPKQLEPVEEPKHNILGEMMKIKESVQKRPKPVCTRFYRNVRSRIGTRQNMTKMIQIKYREKKNLKYRVEYLPSYNDANDAFDIGNL